MRWYDFYKQFFPQLKTAIIKQNVLCPFHEDKNPSLSLDLERGLFYCHACKAKGDAFSFYMKYNSCSFNVAKSAIMGNERIPVLSMTEVDVAHEKLLNSPAIQKLLLIKRSWTLDTIKEYKLGWGDERVYIPIIRKDGELQNIRKYDVLHKTKNKFKGVKGFNTPFCWPEKAFLKDLIVVFAGEPDTLLARQFGINGITFTGGEGTFNVESLPAFTGKTVYIVYDIDAIGKKSARFLAEKLAEYAKEVFIINLPEEILPPNGDFTDLYHYCIDKNIEFTSAWNPLTEKAVLISKEEKKEVIYKEVDFYSAVKEKYYQKDISFKGIAVGKNFSPYFAPKKIKVKCDFSKGESCKACKLFFTGGSLEINVNDRDALDLIKCTQGEQRSKIKALIGISGCNQFSLEIETQTIEEIVISPTIDTERIDKQFLVRKVYTKGHNLQLNKTYHYFGKTISDAKTQEATHLFDKQIPELTDLDKFKLSEQDIADLRVFNPAASGFDGVKWKIKQICEDLTYNIPEIIVGRENLIFAYDLVFHSVLSFKFLESVIEKGWLELLALGDTRTGKTKLATKLCKHYKVGEYITLESATLPGIIGGVSQVGKDVTFSWGVLPINDSRLVILDEVNGLDVKDISNLSSIRDNGIAERTVVGSTRKTSARVRLVWISNPRSSNLRISHYSSGIEAIKELMGRPEDISRLDFAVIVAKEDVATGFMNQMSYSKPEHVFTSDLCNKCLMWAWSRREKDIRFTPEAERLILSYAITMSQKYSDSIPLVQGSVQRIKLAKLSVALACRLFSTHDGTTVVVKPEHVEYIVSFLQETYDSDYFGYNDYSTYTKEENAITGEEQVTVEINSLNNCKRFVNKMLSTNQLLFEDLVDFTERSRDYNKQLKSLLVANNCLKRKMNFYYKTPEFVKILKGILETKKKEERKDRRTTK